MDNFFGAFNPLKELDEWLGSPTGELVTGVGESLLGALGTAGKMEQERLQRRNQLANVGGMKSSTRANYTASKASMPQATDPDTLRNAWRSRLRSFMGEAEGTAVKSAGGVNTPSLRSVGLQITGA